MIREINTNDANDLLVLMKQIERESPNMLFEADERKTTIEQQKMMIEKLNSDDKSTIFLSLKNEKAIGYLMVIGNNVRRKMHTCYIVIGVLKFYHKQGIGTELFKHFEAWAISKGITRIELSVITENEPAIALYKKFGFVIEGMKQNSLLINGEYKHEYYMYKILQT